MYCLSLNDKKANKLFMNLMEQKTYEYGVLFELNDEMHYTQGRTVCKNGKAESVNIGCSELKCKLTDVIHSVNMDFGNLSSKFSEVFSPFVSDKKFTQVIINVYHESHHCYQKNVLFQNQLISNDAVVAQTLSEIACVHNSNYYLSSGNYYENPNEIQAELYGIMDTYNYLQDTFPNIEPKYHEQLILDVINDKLAAGYSYWVHPSNGTKFTSLHEVEAAFQKAYEDSFENQHVYYTTNSSNQDEVKKFMDIHPDVRDFYLNQKTGADQDRIIAVITMKIHPEYQSQYKCLDGLDLSYETHIAEPIRKQREMEQKELEQRRRAEQERLFGQVKNRNVSVEHGLPAREHVSHLSRAEQAEAKFGNLFENEIQKQEDTQFT